MTKMNDWPPVSMVIPFHNEEQFLDRCLQSLLKLDYPLYELIPVNDHSTDRSPEIVKKYGIEAFNSSGRGAPAARNAGIRKARYDIIAFIDADCMVDKGWLKRIVTVLKEDEEVGCVGGPIYILSNGDPIQEYAVHLLSTSFGAGNTPFRLGQNTKKGRFYSLAAGNLAVRKNVIQEIGLFEETREGYADAEFCYRIGRAGYKVAYFPQAKVYHIDKGILTLLGLAFRGGSQWAMLNVKKTRTFDIVHLLPPLTFLIFFLFLALGIFYELFHLLSFALFIVYTGMGLIAGLKSTFKSRRLSCVIMVPVLGAFIHLSYTMGYIKSFLSQLRRRILDKLSQLSQMLKILLTRNNGRSHQ